MPRKSTGILLFRRPRGVLEVLLAHPGGPFWTNRDEGAWSIPKGEFAEDEDPLEAARREFEEELGSSVRGDALPLTPIRQRGGKVVHAWAVEGDLECSLVKSNEFEMEWPPKSGQMACFPEVDRAAWFDVPTALQKINPAQGSIVTELTAILHQVPDSTDE